MYSKCYTGTIFSFHGCCSLFKTCGFLLINSADERVGRSFTYLHLQPNSISFSPETSQHHFYSLGNSISSILLFITIGSLISSYTQLILYLARAAVAELFHVYRHFFSHFETQSPPLFMASHLSKTPDKDCCWFCVIGGHENGVNRLQCCIAQFNFSTHILWGSCQVCAGTTVRR